MSEDLADLIDRFGAAAGAYQAATTGLPDSELDEVAALAERLQQFRSLLDGYEDRATGSGDFRGYLEFRTEVETFVAELPDDLPQRTAFETARDHLEQRRLRPSHFETAREALSPAQDRVDQLAERRAAADELRTIRTALEERLTARETEIDRLRSLAAYDDVPVETSIEPLRTPITAYNDAVTQAFNRFHRDVPATTVIELFGLSDRYPLVDLPPPPAGLAGALERHGLADATVSELVDYADFSRSKLGHYVDEADVVQPLLRDHRQYFTEMDATPFTLEWPPPPADTLWWESRQLIAVLDRFADAETIARLRSVRSLARDADRYAMLRRVAIAREDLSAAERRLLADGRRPAVRDHLVARREQLADALAGAPVPTGG